MPSRFFPRRELGIALALSSLLHLAVFSPPLRWDWRAPAPLPPPPRLMATLAPNSSPPAPIVKPVPPPVTPAAEPPVTPAPDPVVAALPPADAETPAPDTAAIPLPGEAASVSFPAVEPQDESAAEHIDFFPAHGEVRYSVYRGTQGFEIGRAELRWEIEGDRYRLSSLLKTTGLAALFYPAEIVSDSVGSIGAHGLRPESYQQTHDRDAPERVEFDRVAQQVRINQNPPVEMNANSHDFLSLQYQFAYNALPGSIAAGARGTLDFWLATHKKYEHIQFVIIGEEVLELPAGRFNTLHVQTAGETSTDIWLAQDYLMLPVRLHFTDKNGKHYEQVAREILVEPEEKEIGDQ
ncbi:MAG: DUF3108 domain-containing protein [Zoogloeaceae bacterium]|jgi:hypothetical protein|nr:DUF3108 domain-containing protein [Zoogloeaceae bacterium]